MDSEADRLHSSPGFPHSDILGSRPACGSPRLIAASYVLHRLLMPGHSPYTLSSLTITLLLIHMVFQQDLFSCQRTTPMTLSSANCLEDVEQELNRNQRLNQTQPTIRSPITLRQPIKVANGSSEAWFGGAGRNRTDDPLLAKQVLSQLSYSPKLKVRVCALIACGACPADQDSDGGPG